MLCLAQSDLPLSKTSPYVEPLITTVGLPSINPIINFP